MHRKYFSNWLPKESLQIFFWNFPLSLGNSRKLRCQLKKISKKTIWLHMYGVQKLPLHSNYKWKAKQIERPAPPLVFIRQRGHTRQTIAPKIGETDEQIRKVIAYQGRDSWAETAVEPVLGQENGFLIDKSLKHECRQLQGIPVKGRGWKGSHKLVRFTSRSSAGFPQ